MADPRGFLKARDRQLPASRPVPLRLRDFHDVTAHGADGRPLPQPYLAEQAARCMDCGIPFCHVGCPLGNLIPEWNDLVRLGRFVEAAERLHQTNNFPEITGRICPAPCETSCVLGISQPPVTIKNVEVSIADAAFDAGLDAWAPHRLTGRTVAVVGSGPAGLAAAQQLTRAGHTVAVYERDDAIGGLLRYGVPDFKLDKRHLEPRLDQMRAEGTRFRPGVTVGQDVTWTQLRARYDAIVVATGATVPRPLRVPGADLAGVMPAMDFLRPANRAVRRGEPVPTALSAEGRHVVVVGGGDTGSDCVGTALREGAASVMSLAIGRRPPDRRPADQPWPTDPVLYEVSSSHAEGGERVYLASTVALVGDDAGHVRTLRWAATSYLDDGRRVPTAGTDQEVPADLVLVALGFSGPETTTPVDQLGLVTTDRGTFWRDGTYATSVPGVFVAGDAGRGQSLVVWAIAEGRAVAAAVDTYLEGSTQLPAPVAPGTQALRP